MRVGVDLPPAALGGVLAGQEDHLVTLHLQLLHEGR